MGYIFKILQNIKSYKVDLVYFSVFEIHFLLTEFLLSLPLGKKYVI